MAQILAQVMDLSLLVCPFLDLSSLVSWVAMTFARMWKKIQKADDKEKWVEKWSHKFATQLVGFATVVTITEV